MAEIKWDDDIEYEEWCKNYIIDSYDNDWEKISRKVFLTEKFIRKYQDKVDWNNISDCQKLSEDFIIEFQNKVYWDYISYSQKLSLKFIKENIEKLNVKHLLENENISNEIKQELKMYSEIL